MAKAKGTGQSLHIKSKSATKNLDKVLSNGCVTVVVILASWCGACKRALPMWLKQLKKKNEKNIVLLDNEQLPNTSLSSLNITHFPSTFEIPAGGKATLLSNPQDEKSLDALVNSAPTEPEEITASEYVNMPRPTVVNSRENSMENSMNSRSMNKPSENSMNSRENSMNSRENSMNSRENSMNSMASSMEKTRDGFTPTLEKLKGGRRTRRKLSKRRMTRRH